MKLLLPWIANAEGVIIIRVMRALRGRLRRDGKRRDVGSRRGAGHDCSWNVRERRALDRRRKKREKKGGGCGRKTRGGDGEQTLMAITFQLRHEAFTLAAHSDNGKKNLTSTMHNVYINVSEDNHTS